MESRVVISQPDLRLVGRVRVSVIFTVIANLITIGEWVWWGVEGGGGGVMWGWGEDGVVVGSSVRSQPKLLSSSVLSPPFHFRKHDLWHDRL